MSRTRKLRKCDVGDDIPSIDFTPLFVFLQNKGLSENDFIDIANISKGVMQRLRHNKDVKLSTITKIINGINIINNNKECTLETFTLLIYKNK